MKCSEVKEGTTEESEERKGSGGLYYCIIVEGRKDEEGRKEGKMRKKY